jgi:predicted GIY-YIG superfamily endonuclease
MSTYYTENGTYIRNPTAYAKTGAPMYLTKYGKTQDINEETDIYKLELQCGKKYIGKTTNIDRRMDQHFSGNGAKVTQKFKPINGEIVDTCPGFFSDKVEQKHTDKNIKKHGYNNVRGGKYTNSHTLTENKKVFKCGKRGHYANNCHSDNHSDNDSDNDSDCIFD